MRYWRLTYKEALWGLSFQNLMLLNMSIPQYDKDGNKMEPPTELKGIDLKSRFKKKNK